MDDRPENTSKKGCAGQLLEAHLNPLIILIVESLHELGLYGEGSDLIHKHVDHELVRLRSSDLYNGSVFFSLNCY